MPNKIWGFQIQKDDLGIAVILCILFVRFFKTIIFGKFISKIFLITHWDSLFYPLRAANSFQVDSSLIQLYLPYRFFIANYWRHGVPLWNELSGFGMPLLADPQAFVFSPIFALFYCFPNMWVWNLTLVLELAIGAIFTYLLCRELELEPIGALISAVFFTLCPYLQWNLELFGNGYCFVPLVSLFFVRAAKQNTFSRNSVAGAAAAADILSAHPEIAFVTIIFSSLLLYLIAYYHDKPKYSHVSTSKQLALIGIVTFGLSAPLLLPFFEFMRNCQTYKFNRPVLPDVSLQALVAHFLFPFYSTGSLFLGPLSWWGLSAVICIPNKCNRFLQPLIVCLFVSILALTRVFPLDILFKLPPLSMVLANYFFPEYLLLLSIVSGFGIDLLMTNLSNGISKRIMFSIAFVAAMSLMPAIIFPWHHNCSNIHFEYTFENPHFEWRQWLFNILWVTGMFLTLFLITGKRNKLKTIGTLSFVTLGVLSLVIISVPSLPERPTFQYPTTLPLNIISSNCSRFLSLGDHLFRPDTNVIYHLPTIRAFNPLYPKGYVQFVKACGATNEEYFQNFQATISHMLDLTGTRTILSEQPLIDENVLVSSSNKRTAPIDLKNIVAKYSDILTIRKVELYHDSKAKSVFCRLLVVPGLQPLDCHLHCDIEGEDGKSISFIEPQPIIQSLGAQQVTLSGFLPDSARHWSIRVRLTCDRDSSPVQLTSTNFGTTCANSTWLLATSDQQSLFTEVTSNRFVPLSHYGGSITSYENKTALDRYFFVKGIKWIQQRESALDYLKSSVENLSNIAILEEADRSSFEEFLKKLRSTSEPSPPKVFDQSGTIKRSRSTNSHFNIGSIVDLEVESPQTSLIVASDIYYPGWKVFLDGTNWPMFRADYLFRAVIVPAGKHHIRFEYLPTSLIIGLFIFLLTLTTLFVQYLKFRLLRQPVLSTV